MNVTRAVGAHALVSSLEHLAQLTVQERVALETLPIKVVSAAAGQEIRLSGQVPSASYLILEGWISASKNAVAGRRQITNFHIPGDMPDLRSLHLKVIDSDMTAVTACRLALLGHAELLALTRVHPGIAEALWKHTLVTRLSKDGHMPQGHASAQGGYSSLRTGASAAGDKSRSPEPRCCRFVLPVVVCAQLLGAGRDGHSG